MTNEMIDCWNWDRPIFSSDKIKELNKIINERYITTESTEDGAKDLDGNYLKNIKPKIIFYKDIKEEIHNLIESAYYHCHYSFGFTTFPVNSWNELLYNEYASDIKGRYDEHDDVSKSLLFDARMTLLLNLSEDYYEGGDFLVNGQTQDFFRVPGTAILFKSYLPHEVTPVTKGKRISLVYFISGPRFR
tara:strand:- start:73 stop:639 length:567 start_codon:yes stop_codon:yes gene_type:complete